MNRSDAPKKQSVPFGINGQREDLLSKTPAGDNSASYDAGFPAVTMILKAAGGLPPKGQDMNQILYELSSIARWFSAGAMNGYDSDFSTAIGGYPMGSVVLGSDGLTQYMNTVESNTTNPNDSSSSGWQSIDSKYLQASNDLSDLGNSSNARNNLGLGTAALKNVGKGSDQIPDMSFFEKKSTGGVFSAITIAGQCEIIEGNGSVTFTDGIADFTLPISFPSTGYTFICQDIGIGVVSYSSNPLSGNVARLFGRDGPGNLLNGLYKFKYIAMGGV